MNHFELKDGVLHAEGVSIERIAEEVGTPVYIYSRATLVRHFRVMQRAFSDIDHTICYAVKANSNIAVLQLLAKLGSGFDIVSDGELRRVLFAGGDPKKVVFSGVGKTREEVKSALKAGILCINIESAFEIDLVEAVAAKMGLVAPVSLRVNPDVDAKTHEYIATGLSSNKFGVPMADALELYRRIHASPHMDAFGVDCHIGSQITEVDPLIEAMDRMLGLVDQLRADGMDIHHLDMGGGLGIRYRDETPLTPKALGEAYAARLKPRGLRLVVEPGRVICGNAGVLVMRVLGDKTNGDKRFCVVDAAMNDNIRPSLYKAYQGIDAVKPRPGHTVTVDIVGPVCESGDFFARDREVSPFEAGDLVAMRSCGAYGFTMASNYNSRPRPAEVMVHGDCYTVIRRRESAADLFALEQRLDDDWSGLRADDSAV